MMDCKAALNESAGEIEAAVDWLRKKGLAKAAKKAGRVAAEGLVGVTVSGTKGAVVEVNSETDFVARNEDFQSFVREVSQLALATGGDAQKVAAATHKPTGQSVSEALTGLIAKIGENLSFRRSAALTVDAGVVAAYMHNQIAPGLGKIGVLVALKSKRSPNRSPCMSPRPIRWPGPRQSSTPRSSHANVMFWRRSSARPAKRKK
jgi:elongation factor Ts